MQETLARWQFAFTSVNHFFFVPVTIGLAFLTAMLQTSWYRRRSPEYLRLTRFFGTLLVINVAIGVVTGLVQEFQFGMNPLQAQYSQQYGPGYYVPNVFIQYWGMRVMAYLAVVVTLVALWGLWLSHRERLATSRIFLCCATWMAVLPFGMNTAGWLLTESGRQPWIVQGIMLTRNGLSTSVSATELWISVIGFVLLYGTLGTIDLILMLRYSRRQLEPPAAEQDAGEPVPAVQY